MASSQDDESSVAIEMKGKDEPKGMTEEEKEQQKKDAPKQQQQEQEVDTTDDEEDDGEEGEDEEGDDDDDEDDDGEEGEDGDEEYGEEEGEGEDGEPSGGENGGENTAYQGQRSGEPRQSKRISTKNDESARRSVRAPSGNVNQQAQQKADGEAPNPPTNPDAQKASLKKKRKKKNPTLLDKINARKTSEQPLMGIKVDEHHKNYVLMYVMLLGIRTTLSRCHAKSPRPLVEEDFTAAHKLAFDITGREMTPSSKYDFKFKDYSPWVFRSLREHFKLDAADYLVSLTGRYVLSELGSPGKSGSFFYFSQDYRFIIKTISHTEHKFFRGIIKNYYEYVINNPNTLISRYYGLHRIKLSRGAKIHFVVMGNIFPPNKDIHETYDLKGSTVGRYVEVKKDEKTGQGKPKVLKDLNFNRKIMLGPEKRKIFVEQIQKDSEFLARMNIMDYSLLLGIHDLTRGNAEQLRDQTLSVFEPPTKAKGDRTITKKQRKEMKKAISRSATVALESSKAKLPEVSPKERVISVFYQDDGGFLSTDENNQPLNEIYHMGIIDILTPYDGIKKFEHAFKSINHDPNAISAVDPQRYASRFIDFLVNGTPDYSKNKKKKGKKLGAESDSDNDVRASIDVKDRS